MNKQSGTTLLLVVMLISISLLLTTAWVETTVLTVHTQQNYVDKYEALKYAEDGLDQLINWWNECNKQNPSDEFDLYLTPVSDLINPINNNQLVDLAWWQANDKLQKTLKLENGYVLLSKLCETHVNSNDLTPYSVYYQVIIIGFTPDKQAKAVIQVTLRKTFPQSTFTSASLSVLSWQQLR